MVPKTHPLLINVHKPFITVEDITKTQMQPNPVLYNPNASEETNKKLIRRLTKQYFNKRLSPIAVKKLIECGKDTDLFIANYKGYINKK